MRNLLLIFVGLLAGYVQCQDTFYLRAAGVAVPDFDERIKSLNKLHKRGLNDDNIGKEGIPELTNFIELAKDGYDPASIDGTSGINVIKDDTPVLEKRQTPTSSTATATGTSTTTSSVATSTASTGTMIMIEPTEIPTVARGQDWYYVGPDDDKISTVKYPNAAPSGGFNNNVLDGNYVRCENLGSNTVLVAYKTNTGLSHVSQIYYYGTPGSTLTFDDKFKILEVYAQCLYEYSTLTKNENYDSYKQANDKIPCNRGFKSKTIYDILGTATSRLGLLTPKKRKDELPCLVVRLPGTNLASAEITVCPDKPERYKAVDKYIPAWNPRFISMEAPSSSIDKAHHDLNNCKEWLYKHGYTVGLYYNHDQDERCRGYVFSRVRRCTQTYTPLMYDGSLVTNYANFGDLSNMQKAPCVANNKFLTIKGNPEVCIPSMTLTKDVESKYVTLIADFNCCKASVDGDDKTRYANMPDNMSWPS